MATELMTRDPGALAEQVAIAGDLTKLTPTERMAYYGEVCRSLGLNPLTRPFQYLSLNGKMVLYATRDCTDQLRQSRRVSIAIVSRERIEDVYVVTSRATTPDGRSDESTGVVSIGGLKGDNLANALMKAETKSKRRVTLSICGLGWVDETETETIPNSRPVVVDDQGNIRNGAEFRPQSLPAPVRDLSEVRSLVAQIRQRGGDPGTITPREMREMDDATFVSFVDGMYQVLEAMSEANGAAAAAAADEVPANL